MRKIYHRLLAGILAAALVAGTTGMSNVKAQELTGATGVLAQSQAVEELLNQDQEPDEAAAKQVKAILYGCTEYGLRTEPNGIDELITLYSGHQMVVKTLVAAEDGSYWYEVETGVSGTVYCGYVPVEYVLCNAVDNLDTIGYENRGGMSFSLAAEDGEEPGEPIENEVLEEQPELFSDVDSVARLAADDFEASIAGFPESYKASLRTLHAAHPNWVFVPQITNIDWNTFIEAEMSPERSLVPRSMDDAYKGKQPWAYQNGDYVGLSGYNWVQASQEAVEYYADPRNGLTEDRIFQFELLTHNEAYQTEAGVEAIINGTFMSHAVMSDDVITYAQAFCRVGREANVSPYMLAARVRQEQGAGTSPLISGLYPGYENLYNFFNIGAYGSTETEIWVNGLNRARQEGWTNRFSSIAGGASILSGNYISKGQDTLYLQKFDVDDSYFGLFSHQYMQNILGAYNEGNTAYKAYANMGILDNSFVFKIPVYQNMPINAVPQPGVSKYNEAEIKAFINRLYQNILLREADESGLYFWYNRLTVDGATAAAVTANFVFSQEFENQNVSDDVFVERMYLTMMNRGSDPSGKAYWLDVLNSGFSRRYVLAKFVSSQEFTNICNTYGVVKGSVDLREARDRYPGITGFVTRLYQTTLHRSPDVDGLNYWVQSIGTKQKTPYFAAEQIVRSQEFKNYNYSNDEYVTILYRAFFDREPDGAGKQYWLNRISAGTSREEVLRYFAYSEEFKNIAAGYGL